jgi:gamma-glutamylcyclotransferase (GGCT)/AIG2-like uncharacterized protein YtfP
MSKKYFLFVYGTLLDPEIQLSVFGRVIEGRSDQLIGYKVVKKTFLSGKYPAVVSNRSSITEGKVLTVTEDELNSADRYEGDEYTRGEVQLESGCLAWIYIPA